MEFLVLDKIYISSKAIFSQHIVMYFTSNLFYHTDPHFEIIIKALKNGFNFYNIYLKRYNTYTYLTK